MAACDDQHSRPWGVITAAAIILDGSLGALKLSSDLLLKQIGFAFSFSILVDALFVGMSFLLWWLLRRM
jgi:uncharacterized membrane protein YdfJ with MMPL/SSD domain